MERSFCYYCDGRNGGVTENETPEQRTLLDEFMAREHTPEQLRNCQADLSKSNVCPRHWLQPKEVTNNQLP